MNQQQVRDREREAQYQARIRKLENIIEELIENSKFMRDEYSDMDAAVTKARAALNHPKEPDNG